MTTHHAAWPFLALSAPALQEEALAALADTEALAAAPAPAMLAYLADNPPAAADLHRQLRAQAAGACGSGGLGCVGARARLPQPRQQAGPACPACSAQSSDLGQGPALWELEQTYPRAKDMSVVRPAAAPYSDGLFVSMCLPRKASAVLRGHALLAALLPGARWVGSS